MEIKIQPYYIRSLRLGGCKTTSIVYMIRKDNGEKFI